ncbi:MAG: amidohydrolase family protein [Dehalococcoidia bacterium]
MSPTRAIDAWINPNLPYEVQGVRDVNYLFKGWTERRAKGTTLDEMIEEMDAAGVEKGILCAGYGEAEDRQWVVDAINRFPDRLAGSLVVDPRRGMDGLREVDRFVNDHKFKMIRFLAFEVQLPYDHAVYYPFYAKAIELDIAVGVNVGIPGPLVPGKHQHPLALDEVCWFFPELKLVMQHGGEPWADLCVKLMLKWKNLYYMSSAFAPKHIPKEIIQFANTRGADKIMFASDYPLLEFDRCLAEAKELPFRDEERRDKFLYQNAYRLFFDDARQNA